MFGEAKEIALVIISAIVALFGWFFNRSVKRVDSDIEGLGRRISELEAMKADIMLRPDVLALYSDQKEEFRQKFQELREDHRELRREVVGQLNAIQQTLGRKGANDEPLSQSYRIFNRWHR